MDKLEGEAQHGSLRIQGLKASRHRVPKCLLNLLSQLLLITENLFQIDFGAV